MMEAEVKRGLRGVIADTSAVSQVVPETSTLTYRGYAVGDLCEHASFEEVCYLLLTGNLPTVDELNVFKEKERQARVLPPEIVKTLANFPPNCHPMDILRSFVSVMGMHDTALYEDFEDFQTFSINRAIQLIGMLPSCVAWDICRRTGRPFTPPVSELSLSDNFLNMTFGSVPAPELSHAFDVSMILYAEHSFNASTFTGRVITSTRSDYYSAITGAIGALKGPLHGGANESVMHMFEKIGSVDAAEQWIMRAFQTKQLIMGFGHRVYRSGDSRVPTMKKQLLEVVRMTNDTTLLPMYEKVAEVVWREKKLHPNLDYPSAPVYALLGFPIMFFTPLFVMSRLAGWSAHLFEQHANNQLIRPVCAYTGAAPRKILPLAQRHHTN